MNFRQAHHRSIQAGNFQARIPKFEELEDPNQQNLEQPEIRDGEYVVRAKYNGQITTVHYRAYDAQWIPQADESKFPDARIASRVRAPDRKRRLPTWGV